MGFERKTPMSRGSKPLKQGGPIARKAPMPTGRPPTRNPDAPLGGQYRSSMRPPDKYPMRPSGPIARSAQPSADKAPAQRKPPKRAPRATGPTQRVLAILQGRDQGRCVRCGGQASNTHHRENRGMGGRKGAESGRINGPAYLLSLCGSGTTGCHGWVTEHPAEATRDGYVIPKNRHQIDAATTPILTVDGWALFHADGTRTPTDPPSEEDTIHA